MEVLQSVEEYKELVRQTRAEHNDLFSNIYYMPGEIQRYIDLQRAYYEKVQGGFFLTLDEEAYYRVCMSIDTNCDILIPQLDKKTVVKNVYKQGKEEKELEVAETVLQNQGFELEGTVVQIKSDVHSLFEKCQKLERYVEKLQKKGFYCIEADDTYSEKINEILYSSQKVRDYQIDYRTDEEKKEMYKGTFLCVINDKNEICAVNVCYVEGTTAYGQGVAIAEEYKMQGLAPVMSYYRLKKLVEMGVKNIQAWILTDNEVSLRYHTSLGYRIVNKYVNEWVRK